MKYILLIFVCIFILPFFYGCGSEEKEPYSVFGDTGTPSVVDPDNISTFYGTYRLRGLILGGRNIDKTFIKGLAALDESGLRIKMQIGGITGVTDIYVYESVTSTSSLADANVMIRPDERGIRTEFTESDARMTLEKVSDQPVELLDKPFYDFKHTSNDEPDHMSGTYAVRSGIFVVSTEDWTRPESAETCHVKPGGYVSIHMPSETVLYRMDIECPSDAGSAVKNIRLEVKRSAGDFTSKRWANPPSSNGDGTWNLSLTDVSGNLVVDGKVTIYKIYDAFRMFY